MEEDTIADSIAVGVPRNGEKALRAIRESGGIAVNVSDGEILAAMRLLGTSGIFGEPAGVTGLAGLGKAAERGLVPEDALAVSVVTGNGLKDVAGAQKAAAELGQPISIPADMGLLVEEFGRRNIRP
jgi:threonine synthase